MITECELLQSYGETCEAVEDGLPTWATFVLIGVALVTVAVFQWADRTGRLPYYWQDEETR